MSMKTVLRQYNLKFRPEKSGMTPKFFLQDYRRNGYNIAMVSAREIAEDVGVDQRFLIFLALVPLKIL